jgi:hypothetical protein
MTGYKELGRQVSGSSGEPVRTAVDGSIETNNYSDAIGFNFDGSTYPYTVNPSFQGEYLNLTEAGNVEIVFTLVNGTTITIPVRGATGDIPVLSHTEFTINDPNNTGSRIAGFVAGDS